MFIYKFVHTNGVRSIIDYADFSFFIFIRSPNTFKKVLLNVIIIFLFSEDTIPYQFSKREVRIFVIFSSLFQMWEHHGQSDNIWKILSLSNLQRLQFLTASSTYLFFSKTILHMCRFSKWTCAGILLLCSGIFIFRNRLVSFFRFKLGKMGSFLKVYSAPYLH